MCSLKNNMFYWYGKYFWASVVSTQQAHSDWKERRVFIICVGVCVCVGGGAQEVSEVGKQAFLCVPPQTAPLSPSMPTWRPTATRVSGTRPGSRLSRTSIHKDYACKKKKSKRSFRCQHIARCGDWFWVCSVFTQLAAKPPLETGLECKWQSSSSSRSSRSPRWTRRRLDSRAPGERWLSPGCCTTNVPVCSSYTWVIAPHGRRACSVLVRRCWHAHLPVTCSFNDGVFQGWGS